MDQSSLFDAAPYDTAAPLGGGPTQKISADRRRTLRQAAAIARGQHPLSLVITGIRVHPDADPARTATKDNTADRPLRCGTCLHREHVRSFPKCVIAAPTYPNGNPAHEHAPRFSHGGSTDVRSWWPACTDHAPRPEDGSP